MTFFLRPTIVFLYRATNDGQIGKDMEQTQCIEKLMLFGLTRQEAVIYLCLLQKHELTGYEAAKQTGISRSNVYNALAGLVEQGAAYVAAGSTSKYVAVSVAEFCENHIHRMEQTKEFLIQNMPETQTTGEGYVTVAGARHIRDKIYHMLKSATLRVYLSAPEEMLTEFAPELQKLAEKKIKVVILAEKLPEGLSNVLFYRTEKEDAVPERNQFKLIIDSAYVLTGDSGGAESDTCLYSDQKNFVNVFKEAMHNEIKLIELRDKEENEKSIRNQRDD